MGANQSILESNVMLVVYLQNLGAAELRFLWLQRIPCVRSWVVLLSYSPLVNKESSSSKLILSFFMYIVLMNMCDYVIYMLFI